MVAVALNISDVFRKNMNTANAVNMHLNAALKMMIVTNAYVPNQNTHEFITSANANEVSGTGYTAGGNSCLNGSVTMDGAGLVTVDCDDPATWAQNAAGFSNGRYAILYHDTGVAATSRIVGVSAAFAADQGNVAGDFSVQVNPAGLFTMAR